MHIREKFPKIPHMWIEEEQELGPSKPPNSRQVITEEIVIEKQPNEMVNQTGFLRWLWLAHPSCWQKAGCGAECRFWNFSGKTSRLSQYLTKPILAPVQRTRWVVISSTLLTPTRSLHLHAKPLVQGDK